MLATIAPSARALRACDANVCRDFARTRLINWVYALTSELPAITDICDRLAQSRNWLSTAMPMAIRAGTQPAYISLATSWPGNSVVNSCRGRRVELARTAVPNAM